MICFSKAFVKTSRVGVCFGNLFVSPTLAFFGIQAISSEVCRWFFWCRGNTRSDRWICPFRTLFGHQGTKRKTSDAESELDGFF